MRKRAGPIVVLALLACRGSESSPSAAPRATAAATSAAFVPRCIRAGGTCVGPSSLRGSPVVPPDPCPQGMRRVDDVTLADAASDGSPACLGIPFGEEACCMPK